ncbi:hypothetical protein TNCV_4878731 [Trichonephila clavipes]|nr:hypothetical protein TNCV_4878731 [Trichonephila clavipes]
MQLESMRAFYKYKVLPNSTGKFRGVIVGSIGTTNQHRTWGCEPRSVGVIFKNNYEGMMLSGTKKGNNAKPHVARHVLTFLDAQGIRLLPLSAWSLNLSPFEISVLGLMTTVSLHHSPDYTVDEVGHRLEAAWHERPIPVI